MIVKVPHACKLDGDDKGVAFASLLKAEHNVSVLAGSRCGPAGADYIRDCFAYISANEIKEGAFSNKQLIDNNYGERGGYKA